MRRMEYGNFHSPHAPGTALRASRYNIILGFAQSMEAHLRRVGLLNIALGIFGLFICAVIFVLFGGPNGILLINARVGGSTTTTEGFVTACIMIYFLFMAAPLILVGKGLLQCQEWARNLGMILSIVNLINIPFGTIVAVYSLWVLTSYEIEPLFTAPPRNRQDLAPPR